MLPILDGTSHSCRLPENAHGKYLRTQSIGKSIKRRVCSQIVNVRGAKLTDEVFDKFSVRKHVVRGEPDYEIARRKIGSGKNESFKHIIQRASNYLY